MTDRAATSGVTVWIALRRAHQGGVANLQGHWLDSGRPVPCYVAHALDKLTSTGILVLGEEDPKACGVRRATVTDTGCAYYVALCQVHNPTRRALVGTPQRWARSPYDQRSHLLTVRGADQVGVLATMGLLIAVCGHRMLWSVPTSPRPTGPACPSCDALPSVPVPAPTVRQLPLRPATQPALFPRPRRRLAAGRASHPPSLLAASRIHTSDHSAAGCHIGADARDGAGRTGAS